jgi:hypothetical protein
MRRFLFLLALCLALCGCGNGPRLDIDAGTYTATTPDLSNAGDKAVLTLLTNKLNQEPTVNVFILRYKVVSSIGTSAEQIILFDKAQSILEKKVGAWYERYTGVTHQIIYQAISDSSFTSAADLAKYGATSMGSMHESKIA